MEGYVEEVDFVLLPAVFLQQLHQHGAPFGLLLLFLGSLLLWSHLITVTAIALVLLLLLLLLLLITIIIMWMVPFCENQQKLGVLPKRL